jgi:hypothetical protein
MVIIVSTFATGTKKARPFWCGADPGRFRLLSDFHRPVEYVHKAAEMQDIEITQLPRRYAKCEGALNSDVFPAWKSLSAWNSARCCLAESAVDRGGSLPEARPEGADRFVLALTDDEAARVKEETKDARWIGTKFGESRSRFREGALPAHLLAKNMVATLTLVLRRFPLLTRMIYGQRK